MGMYDNVRYKAPCPWCGKEMKEFQTKDEDCNLEMLEPWNVTYFYALCECGCFMEINTGETRDSKKNRRQPIPGREPPRIEEL